MRTLIKRMTLTKMMMKKVTTLEDKRVWSRTKKTTPTLMKNLSFSMRSNRKTEGKFGRTITKPGWTNKLLKLKEDKLKQRKNRNKTKNKRKLTILLTLW